MEESIATGCKYKTDSIELGQIKNNYETLD
jgi:hypothetical protein